MGFYDCDVLNDTLRYDDPVSYIIVVVAGIKPQSTILVSIKKAHTYAWGWF